ncbi:MAG: class I SAM-dependent methyltransferase [Actinomycetota bacterium]
MRLRTNAPAETDHRDMTDAMVETVGMSDRLSPGERASANERRRRQYAREAPRYDKETDLVERWLFGSEHRRWACSRVTGDTLEVAIGTGLNLPNYPPNVRVTGLDLTPEMLTLARQRAADLRRPVALCEGDAQALPFGDGTFDSIVSTYAMCSVPDERRTIEEMKRVLKPGGRLILVDHVRSTVSWIYWIQRLMELAPTRNEDELTRRPMAEVIAAGFTIEASDRLRAGIIERFVARRS